MNNDWIIWNGGECPVPGKRVQVQFRYQSRIEAERYEGREADLLRWGHAGNGGDIIAYRIIPEPLWAERYISSDVSCGYSEYLGGIFLSPERMSNQTHRLRIPIKLVNGKCEIDDSRQPEWGEL